MGGKASKKAAQAAAPAGPLELLVEGGKVYLTSKATGKLLRVDEGAVDVSTYISRVFSSGIVLLVAVRCMFVCTAFAATPAYCAVQ